MPSSKSNRTDPGKLDNLFSDEVVGSPTVSCNRASAALLPEEPFEEESIICAAICDCDKTCKVSGEKKGQCVKRILWGYDDACGNESTIKAEVPYISTRRDYDRLRRMGYEFDAEPPPPQPVISKSNPKRATRHCPEGSDIPDVVIVRNGAAKPTQDNLVEVIEIKFPPDSDRMNQEERYRTIGGLNAGYRQLDPKECACGEEEPQRMSVPVIAPKAQKSEKSEIDPTTGRAAGAVGVVAGLAWMAAKLWEAAEVLAPLLAL